MARFAYYGLLALQHRGQETCGAATWDKQLHRFSAPGLVDQVFTESVLEKLPGWVACGAVTAVPEKEVGLIQPVSARTGVRLVLCTNGRVFNYRELAQKYDVPAWSDAQVLAEVLSRKLQQSDPLEAVGELHEEVVGTFSFVAITERGELIAARDPTGLKPLVIGSFGFDYGVIASESCAMDVIGADFKHDIEPGEAYLFTPYSIERKRFAEPNPRYCAFEYVYMARPDSIINGISVYEVRMRIGEKLAEEAAVEGADVVVGVPETAIPFAMAYANRTSTPIHMGFVRTGRRIRSAIKPTQFERLVGVQLKLNPIRRAVAGKKIVIIDDSVVRGTTTKNTVNMLRNRLGVKEVHVRIGSPRLIAPCPFGVEVPARDELIAAHLTDEEVAAVTGADTFCWLSIEGLVEAIGTPREHLCLGCFTGQHIEVAQRGMEFLKELKEAVAG
ncbi:amidophosphoribosyltransferase [archaeon]|nr:amidophosphoribosyltransferase [archaeon]